MSFTDENESEPEVRLLINRTGLTITNRIPNNILECTAICIRPYVHLKVLSFADCREFGLDTEANELVEPFLRFHSISD